MRLDPPTVRVRGHRSALPDVEWSDPACHWAVLYQYLPRPVEGFQTAASDDAGHSGDELVLERTSVAPADVPVGAGTGPLGHVMVASLGSALPADVERASVLLVDLPTGQTGLRSADTPVTAETLHKVLQEYPGCSCVVAGYGEVILVLHAGDEAPRRVAVDGLRSDDERAMTAAALLALTLRLPPGQGGEFPELGDEPASVRCGPIRWRLVMEGPGYPRDPRSFPGPV
jgi:hypothetical protein